MGYYEVAELSGQRDAKQLLLAREEEARKQASEADVTVYRPDFGQMVPFKPKMQWTPGEHMAPGGAFPLPPAASHLCSLLPPPHCFHGPFVLVDPVMELIKHLDLTETGGPLGNTSENARLFDLARSVHWVPKHEPGAERSGRGGGGGGKRSAPVGDESEEEDTTASAGTVGPVGPTTGPPPNDIYRKRQQKRVK